MGPVPLTAGGFDFGRCWIFEFLNFLGVDMEVLVLGWLLCRDVIE